MKFARTLSSLCVACVLTPFIGAGPATQPAAPVTETEQLRQRIAQLEAEVADLRARLERAYQPDAATNLTFTDELKIDRMPPPPARAPSNVKVGSGTLILSGRVNETPSLRGATMPSQRKILQRPPGDLIDDRPAPQKP